MPDRNRDEQENGGDRNRDSNRRSSNRGTSNPRSPQPNRNRRDDRGTYNRENRGAPRDDRGGYRGTREDRPNTREGQGSYRGNREGRGSYQGNREGQGSSYRGNREGQGGYRGNRDNQSGGGYRGTRDDRGGQDRPSYKGNRDDRGGYRNNREGQSSTRDDRPGYNRDRTNDRGGYSGNRDRTNDRGGYSGNRDRTGDRGGYRGNREDRPNTREGQGGYRGNREDRPAYRGARDDRQGSRDNNRGGGYRDREDQGGYRGNRESSSRDDRPARESNYRGNNDRGGYRNNRDDRPAYKGNRDDRPSARDDRGGYRGDRDKTRDDRGSYRPSRDRDDRAPRDRNSDRPASREGRPTYRGSQERTGYQGSRDDRGQERTGYRGNREDRGQERTGFKGNRPNRDDRGGHRGNRDDNRGGYRKDRDDRPTGNDNKTWERGDRYRSTRSDDHAPAEPQTPEPKSGFARKNHYASNTGGEGRTQGYRSRDYEDVTAAPVEPAGSAGEFGITPEQTGQETPADASHADALTATAASTPADNQSTGPGEPNSGIALGAPATTGESNQPGIADGESTTQPEEARAAASVLGEGTATAEPARSDEHRDPAADEPGPEITQAEAAATQRPPATGDSHSTAEPAQPDASEESRRPATAGLGNSDSGADLAQPAGDESGQPATSGRGAASDATLPEAAATEQSTSVGLGNSGATAEPAQPDAQAAVAPEATRSEAAATEQSAPTGPGDSAVEPGQLVAGDESRQQAAPGLDQAGSTAEPAQSSADDQSRQPGLDNSGAAAEPAQPTARDENRQAAASGLGQPSSPAPAQAAANSEAQAATGHSSSGDAVDSSRPAAEGANGESSRPVAAGLGRSDEGGERTSSSYDRPEPRRRDGEPELPDDIQFSDLDPEARRELKSLTKAVAESVGRHLVAAGVLIDEDPELALEHARFARTRASRVAVVREAAGIAAYHAGEWAEALGEFRAVRRMTGSQTHLPVMVDCERALGRPERALELAAEAKDLPTDVAVELKIVTAGARRDLGQLDAAVVGLQGPELDPQKRAPWSARLFYAYADNLAAAGRTDDAIRWFLNAAEADLDEETDAAERATALSAS